MTKVVLLERAKTNSISDTLRAIATAIDLGEYGEPLAGNFILENLDKRIQVFAMGDANYYKTVANLTKAINILVVDPD